jgi:hypothetical protein
MEKVMNKIIRIMVLGLLSLIMVPVQAWDWKKTLWTVAGGLSGLAALVCGRDFRNRPSVGNFGLTAGFAVLSLLSFGSLLCGEADLAMQDSGPSQQPAEREVHELEIDLGKIEFKTTYPNMPFRIDQPNPIQTSTACVNGKQYTKVYESKTGEYYYFWSTNEGQQMNCNKKGQCLDREVWYRSKTGTSNILFDQDLKWEPVTDVSQSQEPHDDTSSNAVEKYSVVHDGISYKKCVAPKPYGTICWFYTICFIEDPDNICEINAPCDSNGTKLSEARYYFDQQ